MAYFLKKSNLKKGVYLQIYESFYDPERRHTAHHSYKSLGYVNELIESGIDDPVSYYKAEVDKLNQQLKAERRNGKAKQISDETPEKFLGYFPLKSVNDFLGVKKIIDLMQTSTNFQFNVFSMISAMIYSQTILPCSKSKAYDKIIPRLYDTYDFSLSQLYSCLEYIGSEYEKIIEIYNHQISHKYSFNTSHSYLYCTNFYFGIDKENDSRKMRISNENKNEPVVGMGLLLDANQIPIDMKIYPNSETENPVIRNITNDLKQHSNISGRTIQLSGNGFNYVENIMHALKSGHGYVFSIPVKMLPETEKTWVLLENGYHDVKNSNGDVIYRIKECVDNFSYDIKDADGKTRTVKLTEKRVVTYNPQLAKKQIYEINRQIEKAKFLKASKAKKSEYGDCAKYVTFITTDKKGSKTNGKFSVVMNEYQIEKAFKLAGYNLLISSETNMSGFEIYSAYHNFLGIEESFKIMKSQLDVRPVYFNKKEIITGHFLICYLSVLLSRLLQFKVLGNSYFTEDIFDFIKSFRVARISEKKHINLTRNSVFIKEFSDLTGLPLTSYFLTDGQIKKMLSHRF